MIPDIQNNAEIEKDLEELPEKVREALVLWRTATLKRKEKEALLGIEIKTQNPKLASSEVKDRVSISLGVYDLRLEEAKAEAEYNFMNDKLMAAKKLASLRTAF